MFQDFRYGIRLLLKAPGFAFIAVATLALGIGANASIFTVVDAALIRGLPYQSPERLYHLWEATPQNDFPQREFSYPDYQDYQRNQVFDGLAAYTGGGAIISGRGEPERIFAPSVSANFFSVLGVNPLIGRTFRAGEDVAGAEKVVVLTYGFWQRMFGGDPGILGQSLTINGGIHTVVGVLPASFQFAMRPADLWLPYQPSEAQLTRRFMHGTNLIGRLKADVSLDQAQEGLSLIAGRIEQEHRQSHAGTGIRLVPLHEQVVGTVRPLLLALLGAVGFILLIACANVASLLLTRATTRQKEIAIRVALGAGRWRVIRQLLTESILISLLGGAAGVLTAYWGVDAAVAALPQDQLNALPFLKSLRINLNVLAFACGLSLLTGIVFGLVPAFQSTHPDLQAFLKEGGRTSGGSSRHRLRGALVIGEIAMAVVLLVGAGLMIKSLWRLLQANVGFDPHNVLTMTVSLPPSKYAEQQRRVNFHDQLQEQIASIPGVIGAGLIDRLPLLAGNTTRFIVEGDPVPPPGQEIEANFRQSNQSYFQSLGIPLIRGRLFNQADGAGVVIINQSIAEKLFAGRDPIGRRLTNPGFNNPPIEIVGVVGDVRVTGLDQEIKPVLYFPHRQGGPMTTSLAVRTSGDPGALVSAVRNACRTLEPDVAIFNVRTMEEMITDSPAAFMRRFPAILTGLFAAVALLLASIGIYGVVAYSVSQQTHDIGVRMALGARGRDILKMVLKQGLALVLTGLAIGAVAAFGLMRLLGSLLYQVGAGDPLTFGSVLFLLALVALLACWFPARRATKVDPIVALRCD